MTLRKKKNLFLHLLPQYDGMPSLEFRLGKKNQNEVGNSSNIYSQALEARKALLKSFIKGFSFKTF